MCPPTNGQLPEWSPRRRPVKTFRSVTCCDWTRPRVPGRCRRRPPGSRRGASAGRPQGASRRATAGPAARGSTGPRSVQDARGTCGATRAGRAGGPAARAGPPGQPGPRAARAGRAPRSSGDRAGRALPARRADRAPPGTAGPAGAAGAAGATRGRRARDRGRGPAGHRRQAHAARQGRSRARRLPPSTSSPGCHAPVGGAAGTVADRVRRRAVTRHSPACFAAGAGTRCRARERGRDRNHRLGRRRVRRAREHRNRRGRHQRLEARLPLGYGHDGRDARDDPGRTTLPPAASTSSAAAPTPARAGRPVVLAAASPSTGGAVGLRDASGRARRRRRLGHRDERARRGRSPHRLRLRQRRPASSIVRLPDGHDTNNNAADFTRHVDPDPASGEPLRCRDVDVRRSGRGLTPSSRPTSSSWEERPYREGRAAAPARPISRPRRTSSESRARALALPAAHARAAGTARSVQEEVFVVLAGTLTMLLGEPPERVRPPAARASSRSSPARPIQVRNESDAEVVVLRLRRAAGRRAGRDTSTTSSSRALAERRGAGRPRPSEDEIAVLRVDEDRVAGDEVAFEQPQRERVLEQPLDRALQRTGAVGRIPARRRRSRPSRRVGELEREAALGEPLAQPRRAAARRSHRSARARAA